MNEITFSMPHVHQRLTIYLTKDEYVKLDYGSRGRTVEGEAIVHIRNTGTQITYDVLSADRWSQILRYLEHIRINFTMYNMQGLAKVVELIEEKVKEIVEEENE